MMTKLWTRTKRKRKRNPSRKRKSSRMIPTTLMNKILRNPVLKSSRMKNSPKRKRENSDRFHIALITRSGKKKIDSNSRIKSLLSLEGTLILRRRSGKKDGCTTQILRVLSLTLNLLFRAEKSTMLIWRIFNLLIISKKMVS